MRAWLVFTAMMVCAVLSGKLVEPPQCVVYDAGDVSSIDAHHRAHTLWQSSPRLMTPQAAAMAYHPYVTAVLSYSLEEDSDYIALFNDVDPFTRGVAKPMGPPLVIHQSSGYSSRQRLAIVNDQHLLVYSPAGQTLLAYTLDSEPQYRGIAYAGHVDALISWKPYNLSTPSQLLMCDQQRLWLMNTNGSQLSDTAWTVQLPGACRWLDVPFRRATHGSVAFQLTDGRLEVWTFRLLDGQSMRQTTQVLASNTALALANQSAVLSVTRQLQVSQQAAWPGANVPIELPLALRGRLLFTYRASAWVVHGADTQYLWYNQSGWYLEGRNAVQLGSDTPLINDDPTLAQYTLETTRSMTARPAILDWARLLLVQEGNSLLQYSLQQNKYLGYWPMGDASLLLDALNENVLLQSRQPNQLLVRNCRSRSVQTVVLASITAPLDAVLCGDLQACVLYADGQLHIHWFGAFKKSAQKVASVLKVPSPVPQDSTLSNPQRLLWDEQHSELVLVSSDLTATVYYTRLAVPAKYSARLTKHTPEWGPVKKVAVQCAVLPPMNVMRGDLVVLLNQTSGLVYQEQQGKLTGLRYEMPSLINRLGWVVVRNGYYRLDGESPSVLLILGMLMMGACLTVCLVITGCLVFRCYQTGSFRSPIYDNFVPVNKHRTRHARAINRLRRALTYVCCCLPEQLQRCADRLLIRDKRDAQMQELRMQDNPTGDPLPLGVDERSFDTDRPLSTRNHRVKDSAVLHAFPKPEGSLLDDASLLNNAEHGGDSLPLSTVDGPFAQRSWSQVPVDDNKH